MLLGHALCCVRRSAPLTSRLGSPRMMLEHDNNQLVAFGSDPVNSESEQNKTEEIRIEKALLVKNRKSVVFFLPPLSEILQQKIKSDSEKAQ